MRVFKVSKSMHTIIERREVGETALSIRAGMNCGSVVSGVIGRSKFCFDIWGDAVNVASRMESTGKPRATHVTSAVYHLLKGKADFTPCGLTWIKGKGEMETYLYKECNTDTDISSNSVGIPASITNSGSLPEVISEVRDFLRPRPSRNASQLCALSTQIQCMPDLISQSQSCSTTIEAPDPTRDQMPHSTTSSSSLWG
jgi:hypothetical protein